MVWGPRFEPGPGSIDCALSTDLAFSPDLSLPIDSYGWTVHDYGFLVAKGQWLSTSIKLQSIPVPAALPLMFAG